MRRQPRTLAASVRPQLTSAEHVRRQQKALSPAVQRKPSNPVAPGIPASGASSPDLRAAIRRVWIEEVNSKSESNPNAQKGLANPF